MAVKLRVTDQKTCQAAMTDQNITKAHFCAGGNEKDTCVVIFPPKIGNILNLFQCFKGDSGGPLTYNSRGQHILIGDVSFGDKCGVKGKYGIYGRISTFRPWIEETMKKLDPPKYCKGGPDAETHDENR